VERFPYREQYRDCYLAWGGGLWIKKTCSPVLNWEVSYTIGTTPPKEEQSRGVIDDRNPLNLQAGNPNLKPKEEHRLTAKWNKLFIANSSSLGLKVDYLLVRNDVASNSRFFSENTYLSAYDYTVQRGATLYTYENTKPNHLVTAKVDYSLLSRLLKSSIKMYVEYTFEKRPSFTQGKPNDLIRNKGVFFFVVESNFSRKVRLSLQSNTQLSSDKSTLNKASEFLDEQASIGVHTNVISKFGVGANFIYTYKKDLALGEDSGKPNLMVNISRRLGRYTSLVLRGINLLDKSTSETFGKTADYTFRSRQLRTAGRCFMLSLDYQF